MSVSRTVSEIFSIK